MERLERVADDVVAAGGEALVAECDVRSSDAVKSAVAKVHERWGEIDLAIANAGVAKPVNSAKLVLEDAELVMTTNFFGMLYLYDAVIPRMIEKRRGHFAGIASLAGLRGMPNFAVYSASKAAMQAFLEAARVELDRSGVRITIINPGFVETEITENNKFPMPFLMNVTRAGAIIERGLDRHARVIQFPLPTSLAMKSVRLLPDPIFDAIMKRAPKKG
jgi:short-subunit dehydrogenase